MNLAAGYPESGVTVRQAIFTVEPLAFEGSISSTHLIYLKSWSALRAWLPTAGFVACSVWFANSSLDDAMHVQSIYIYVHIYMYIYIYTYIYTYIYIYPPSPAAQGGARKGKRVGCAIAISTKKSPSFTDMGICHWESGFGVAAVLGTVRCWAQCGNESASRIRKQNEQTRTASKSSILFWRVSELTVLHFVLQYQILYR